jgi:hypothetical protein
MCPIMHCIYIVAAKVVLLQVMKWGKTSHIIWASMVCGSGMDLKCMWVWLLGLNDDESFPKKTSYLWYEKLFNV